MFFKVPSLNSQGVLSQEDGLKIYNHYLTSDRLDYDGIKRKPTKLSVVHAMIKSHQATAFNLIQKYLDENKNVYFWSDQHFSHNNIIKYSNRPFEDKNHMNSIMVQNYFDTVKENDLVVWGGDVAFGSIDENKQMLANLPGKKILILGNHDFDKNNFKFRNYHIFESEFMSQVFTMKINNKVCNLLMTHYPIDNSLLPPNTLNIHGHIHTHMADVKNINICVEHTGYAPIAIHKIIEEKFLNYC